MGAARAKGKAAREDGTVAEKTTQPPLLILPGALGVADGGGEASALLSQGRRVVTFAYGAERTAEALLGRATAAAGAERFDLLGFSIGGWFAQVLAARRPERVGKVVLAHSFLLEPGQGWRFTAASTLWPLVPAALFRAGGMKRARLALAPLRERDGDGYAAALRELEQKLAAPSTRAVLRAQQEATRDSLRAPLALRDDIALLIVESDNDALVGTTARAALRSRYPKAQRVTIAGAGHAAALVEPEAFAGAVDAFLRG
jgi:pimeloyl-ACP methyl ester carboxylesterase